MGRVVIVTHVLLHELARSQDVHTMTEWATR